MRFDGLSEPPAARSFAGRPCGAAAVTAYDAGRSKYQSMPTHPNQVPIRLTLAACVALAAYVAFAAPACAADARADLAARCDAAVAAAVRSPYGWGWTTDANDAPDPPAAGDGKDGPAGPPKPPRPAPKPAAKQVPAVSAPRRQAVIDGRETAVVGLELFHAGRLLREPKYTSAALEAARGVSAIQARTGQVRARGTMGVFGAAGDPASDVPDRAATVAAMGLWLTLVDDAKGAKDSDGQPVLADERLTRPAAAAARWLVRQQTKAGAFPAVYPPDAPAGKGARLVRLDTPDYRDGAFALLLAGTVLDNRDLLTSFDHAVDQVVGMRVAVGGPVPGRPLWRAAYDLQGQPLWHAADFPDAVDVVASRRMIQVLLAATLAGGGLKSEGAAREAGLALEQLRLLDPVNAGDERARQGQGGKLHRFYDTRGLPAEVVRPATRPAAPPAPGHFPDLIDTNGNAVGAFALDGPDGVLQTARRLGDLAWKEVAKELDDEWPINRRLAETISGLSDDALTVRLSGGERRPARQGRGESDVPLSTRAAELRRLLRQIETESLSPSTKK